MDVSTITCLIAFTQWAFRKLVTSSIISSELDFCDAANGYINEGHCRCNRRYADVLYNILLGLMNIQLIIRIVDFVLIGSFGSTCESNKCVMAKRQKCERSFPLHIKEFSCSLQ